MAYPHSVAESPACVGNRDEAPGYGCANPRRVCAKAVPQPPGQQFGRRGARRPGSSSSVVPGQQGFLQVQLAQHAAEQPRRRYARRAVLDERLPSAATSPGEPPVGRRGSRRPPPPACPALPRGLVRIWAMYRSFCTSANLPVHLRASSSTGPGGPPGGVLAPRSASASAAIRRLHAQLADQPGQSEPVRSSVPTVMKKAGTPASPGTAPWA